MSVREAREFIYRELQELAVECPGTALRWTEDGDCVRLLTANEKGELYDRVALEPGVHEALTCVRSASGETLWQTTEIVFDAHTGWDRESRGLDCRASRPARSGPNRVAVTLSSGTISAVGNAPEVAF